jgi:PTS system N-acetylgalactosamine-specific IIA component
MGEAAGEPSRPRAIVAGHGVFPEGLISAVDQITGRGSVFLAVSNAALGSEEIEAKLRGEAATSGVKVFFTDLPGGSATLAVRRMMRTDPELVLVTGSNLATLLEFVFHSNEDPREAAGRAAEKGRASLAAYGGS